MLDLFDVCDFDLLDLFLSSFYLGLRKVYPYYFTFTTFTKGRWVGEKILDVFAREFRAHPVEEYVSHFWFTVIKVVVEFEMWETRWEILSALFHFIFLFFLIIIVNRRDSVDGGNWNPEIRFKLVMSLLLRVMYTTTVPPSLSARSFVRLSIRLKSGKHALSFFLTVAAAETRGLLSVDTHANKRVTLWFSILSGCHFTL